jgi:hypothetical protein
MKAKQWIALGAMLFSASHFQGPSNRPSQTTSQTAAEKAKMDENLCVLNLRTINTAQATYWGGDQAKGFARTLEQLGPKGEGIVTADIASGKLGNYRFRLIPERTAARGPIKHYTVIAKPTKRFTKNQESFFTDETGVIRFTREDRTPTKHDPPLPPSQ